MRPRLLSARAGPDNTCVSVDLTGAAVALAGIAGTLTAAALTQRAATRNKRLDAVIQRDARADERQEAARATAHTEKRAIYAELNAAARDFRAAGHDHIVDKLSGTDLENFDRLETARTKYRDVYARAQMVLPDRALEVATEVNRCLGRSYRALLDIDRGLNRSISVENLHEWYDQALSEAVALLRHVLREDLGVAEYSSNIGLELQRLREARLRLWGGMEQSSGQRVQD